MIFGKTLIYNTPSDPTPRALIWVGVKPIHPTRFKWLAEDLKRETGEQLTIQNQLAMGTFYYDENKNTFKTFCILSNYDNHAEPDISDEAKKYYETHYKPLVRAEWEKMKNQEDLNKLAAMAAFSKFHAQRY